MEFMVENSWLIPVFPLLAFLVLVAFGRQMKEGAAYVGIMATLASFIMALFTFLERFSQGAETYYKSVHWLTIAGNDVTMGFEVTQLNAMMLLIVSLVSFLVHVYSKGYMHGDDRLPVFYQYLALFTFSMLGLVISPNLLQVYIFWELVGVCSFLLVGFYFYKPEAKAAAKKAFIVTRVGDVALFISIILLFWWTGSFNYADIFNAVQSGAMQEWQITLTAILIFIGAMGKSGQFPLHTWLPDAMEGPTPVSALIHAATMVAAGVYLVATTFDLFSASSTALTVVAYVGGFTAIFAASIGLTQRDIKRVLAYSTVSQLGYMMLALGAAGAAGYVAGTFHLMTHAFFKALLFLAAGSVIHAVHTQDVFEMGGIWKKMKITGWVFLIGCLAIAGIPPFAGYWSKEEILAAVYGAGRFDLFWIAIIAAFFTAFYMFRLFFLTFTGESRTKHHPHESPLVMTVPMLILAALAVVAGLINTPWNPILGDWLAESFTDHAHGHAPAWIGYIAVGVSLTGIWLAWMMYAKGALSRDWFAAKAPVLYQLSFRKYYVDEFYQAVIVRPLTGLGKAFELFDVYVVDGLVKLVAAVNMGIAAIGARMQNGQAQTYGAITIAGLVLFIAVYAAVKGGF